MGEITPTAKALTALLENGLDVKEAHRVTRATHLADLAGLNDEDARALAETLRANGTIKKVGAATLEATHGLLESCRVIVYDYVRTAQYPTEEGAIDVMGAELPIDANLVLQAICDTYTGTYNEGQNFGLLVAHLTGAEG